eukprot:CAMPEP_0176464374 /NCGR_PEP_ID=MMETSP0127-20121128/36484_1 /TAXON_ID=938130 /ORGANISM="Platyophrya macrostoma, Strain WH" /LENGTH=189 /DNA_ID=CAMNT_0017856789 /DNA_START=205 /DNA_END=772 /DNA_ORIENTATION=+
MSEPVNVLPSVPGGSVTSLKVFKAAMKSEEFALLVTNQGFHMLQSDASTPLYSCIGVEGGPCTAGAVSHNGQFAVLGTDKGHLMAMSSTASQSANSEITITPNNHEHRAWMSHDADRGGQMDSGFNYDVPEADLCSSWPSPDYMILSAESRPRLLNIRSAPGTVVYNQWNVNRCVMYVADPKDKVSISL